MTELFYFSVGKLPSGNIYIVRNSAETFERSLAFLHEMGYSELSTQQIAFLHATEALKLCERHVMRTIDGKTLVERLANLSIQPLREEKKSYAAARI